MSCVDSIEVKHVSAGAIHLLVPRFQIYFPLKTGDQRMEIVVGKQVLRELGEKLLTLAKEQGE